MKPYKREDDNGNELTIDSLGNCAALTASTPDGPFRVWPEDVESIALALYEAAGLPVPLMLDRVTPPSGCAWRPYEGSMLTASRFGRQVRIGFDQVNGPASSFPPAKAREMAAALVAYADEAEAEPDPAEVSALALVIAGDCSAAIEDAKPQARRILLAGWKREAEQ